MSPTDLTERITEASQFGRVTNSNARAFLPGAEEVL